MVSIKFHEVKDRLKFVYVRIVYSHSQGSHQQVTSTASPSLVKDPTISILVTQSYLTEESMTIKLFREIFWSEEVYNKAV